MISPDAIDAAMHGVDEQSSLQSRGGDAARKILFGCEGSFAGLVSDEFDAPEEADTADVSNCFFVPQAFEGVFELSGWACGASGVGCFDELVGLQIPQYGASGGE